MLHDRRYTSGQIWAILGLTREQLSYMDTHREARRDGTGWRKRSVMDLFRLMLTKELVAHGVPVEHAVRIAHNAPLVYGDDVHGPGEAEGVPLADQLASKLFGHTLIAWREGEGWAWFVHADDGESEPIGCHIRRSAIVIRLPQLGDDLIARIRQYALGESPQS